MLNLNPPTPFHNRQDAVSRAESALTEAWQAEVGRVGEEGQQRVAELEREVLRLRTQMEDERRRVNDVVGGVCRVRGLCGGSGFLTGARLWAQMSMHRAEPLGGCKDRATVGPRNTAAGCMGDWFP